MLDPLLALGLRLGPWAASGEDSSMVLHIRWRERERINAGARALFLSNTAEERIESLDPLHRIVPESFLIAGRQK